MNSMRYDWGRFAVFAACVILPAFGVGYSNWIVFQESFLLATILIIITVIVAGVVAYFSGDATPKIRKYCNITHIIIGLCLCINLASHFILAREVSAAKTAVSDRHVEEERQDQFRSAEAERQAKLLEKQKDLADAERKRAQAEANRLFQQGKLGIRTNSVRTNPRVASTPEAVTMPTADIRSEKQKHKQLTPEEVINSWYTWLTFWAFVDVFVSVLGGLILASIWEWDRNHDGIADHLQIIERPTSMIMDEAQMRELRNLLSANSHSIKGFNRDDREDTSPK